LPICKRRNSGRTAVRFCNVLAPEVLALNLPRQVPWTPFTALVLRGNGGAVATTLAGLPAGPITVLCLSVLLVVWRAILGRDWLAWVVIWIFGSLVGTPNHDAHPMMDLLISAIIAALVVLLVIQYGIFLFAVAESVFALTWTGVPSLDFSRWYVLPSILALVVVAAIAAYGFRAALAGRPLFGQPLLEQ
jgi:hypothetical protein